MLTITATTRQSLENHEELPRRSSDGPTLNGLCALGSQDLEVKMWSEGF